MGMTATAVADLAAAPGIRPRQHRNASQEDAALRGRGSLVAFESAALMRRVALREAAAYPPAGNPPYKWSNNERREQDDEPEMLVDECKSVVHVYP